MVARRRMSKREGVRAPHAGAAGASEAVACRSALAFARCFSVMLRLQALEGGGSEGGGAGLSLDCLRACTLPRRATPHLKACAALRTSRERLLASAGPKSCDRGARTVVGLRAQGPSVVECQQRGRSSAHLHKAPRLLCEPLHDAVAARHVLSLLLPGNGTRVQKVPGLQRRASARSRSRSGAEGSAGCAKEAVEGEMRWNAPARRAPTQERAERTRGGLTWPGATGSTD